MTTPEEQYSTNFEIGMIGKTVEVGVYTQATNSDPSARWEDKESDEWIATNAGTLLSYSETKDLVSWIVAPGIDTAHVGHVSKDTHVLIITWFE